MAWIEDKINMLVTKYLSKRHGRDVLVYSVFPLKYIFPDSIKLTFKGEKYLEFLLENPNGNEEDFVEWYKEMGYESIIKL